MNQVLLLSGDPVLRQKNIEVLSQNGLQASGVAECLEGLIKLDKNGFDVVVIDEELNDVSGYEACLKVRQQSDVHVILLGSVVESDVWAKVEELGFDFYLRKPVSPRELLVRVKALLRRPPVEKRDSHTVMEKPAQSPTVPPVVGIRGINPAATEEKCKPKPEPSKRKTQTPVQDTPATPAGISRAQPSPPPQTVPPPQAQTVPPPQAQTVPLPQAQTVPPPQAQTVPPLSFTPRPQVVQAQPRAVPPPPAANIPSQVASPQHKEQVVMQPLKDATPQVVKYETSYGEEGEAGVIEDARTLRLIDALVTGKLNEITPVIDITFKLGYAYPQVDSLTETIDQDTVNILEALAKDDVLIKKPFEKLYIDPDGLLQLVPQEHCPSCNSGNLVKGQLVEHFSCGYVGLDKEFKQDTRYICPKCRKELRLIGTDYRNIGIHYRCLDCNEIFTVPVVKWRNLRTRKVWGAEELREIVVYTYVFSPDKKGWLEFQLKPKTQLVDFLRSEGYQVEELVQLTGSSGATHTVDILAIRDDILTKINLGIGILVAPPGETEVGLETLFRFDTRSYDIGINYKVVIALPRLGHEAINFANKQNIRAFEAKTLGAVVSDITGKPASKVKQTDQPGYPVDDRSASGARYSIARFLRNRGYEVFETAKLAGKSGVEHIFDIFARRDDRIIMPTLAIGIAGDPAGQPVETNEVAKFDSAAYDCGIRNKVFLGMPQVSTQARQFARQQKIDIFEWQDLGRLV